MIFSCFFRRLPRRYCTKLLCIAVLTTIIIMISSQVSMSPTQVHAKAIPAEQQPKLSDNDGGDPSLVEAEVERRPIMPIIRDDVDPDRVDVPNNVPIIDHNGLPEGGLLPAAQPANHEAAGPFYINNEKYPLLNGQGKLIPQRRIVHLDLKGGAYKPEFFTELFYFFNRIKATGILIEWEDMFPYTGVLSEAINGNAYSMNDVEKILSEAKRHHLEIIPLVQTFGHLEWILKLEKFAHLREDPNYPMVICFGDEESWKLLTDMIDQVATVHIKYGMTHFHMGADEVFQIGACNSSYLELQRQGSRERLMLWHMARTANYIKDTHKTTVLAWHDMLQQAMESDLHHYHITDSLVPVLWSYAEDLDLYLPRSSWMSLMPFRRVWGSSAWKGADGPARFNTNSMHYIRNHESWVEQFTRNYDSFDVVEGLILSGWSRYDHLACLTELIPVALPTLSMSIETILEGRPLRGSYPVSQDVLQCTPSTEMEVTAPGCRFPGSKVYELINMYWNRRKQLRTYRDSDYELNGWLSRVADKHLVSSKWYLSKIEPLVEYHIKPMQQLESQLREEMAKIYYQETIDEFIFTHMGDDLEWLETKMNTISKINKQISFPKRPYVNYSSNNMLST